MRLSEARKSYLAHQFVAALRRDDLADIDHERLVLSEIKAAFEQDHSVDERIDLAVRKKIASLSRSVPLGSREWDVLYRQYYDEESRKQKPRGA